MEFPEAVIGRVVLFAATSNVELGKLSNVSVKWRTVVKGVVLEQALRKSTASTSNRTSLLLLPSIIRHLVLIQEDQRSTLKSGSEKQKQLECYNETFCAAWFHPDGIQEKKFNYLDDDSGLHAVERVHEHGPFASPRNENDGGKGEGDKQMQQQSDRGRSRSPVPLTLPQSPPPKAKKAPDSSVCVSCTDEWRGFRSPTQVLAPFGYTAAFVNDVLRAATAGSSVDTETPSYADTVLNQTALHQPTFAVRGATIARPESYCLCLDAEQQNLELNTADSPKVNGVSQELANIRVQELQELRARRQKRRRELQRDVLPRVLTCDDNGDADPVTIGRSQRSVQFLNADKSHAVCMMTPEFACGPLAEAVTILCVGIATEDGCFLSGLHHRFELGHLYPSGTVEEVTELSPVCIATDTWQVDSSPVDGQGTSDGDGDDDAGSQQAAFRLSSSDDSSYDFSEEEGSSSFKCDCIFQGIGDKLEEIDEDANRTVRRGKRGPGAWHCYVAVFDDANSTVRIDGLEEPLRVDDSMKRGARPAMMDGLTIGSDHCFGMSLCCGHGSGGEGEGAIAELAVFHGRLDEADIAALERQMMHRHGILPLHNAVGETVWQHDVWDRQAQALFWQAHDRDWNFDERVPLRYMARHRSVAWKQQSPVTGKQVRIQKIGSRPGASSSDW